MLNQVLISVDEKGVIRGVYLRDGRIVRRIAGYTIKGLHDLVPDLLNHLGRGVEDSGEPN